MKGLSPNPKEAFAMSEYQGTFKRYEKKYLVTQQQSNALAKASAARMVPARIAASPISTI